MEIPPRLLEAKATERCLVWLRYENGVAAEVDFSFLLDYDGVFLPLREPGSFRQVRVSEGGWTVEWPGEVDFDPESVYQRAKDASGIAAPTR